MRCTYTEHWMAWGTPAERPPSFGHFGGKFISVRVQYCKYRTLKCDENHVTNAISDHSILNEETSQHERTNSVSPLKIAKRNACRVGGLNDGNIQC